MKLKISLPKFNLSRLFGRLFDRSKNIIAHTTEYDKDGIPNYTWIRERKDCPSWATSMFDSAFGKKKK